MPTRECRVHEMEDFQPLGKGISARQGEETGGESTQGDRESGQAHTGCSVCSWRVSLRLGLGGEAGLPPWHI